MILVIFDVSSYFQDLDDMNIEIMRNTLYKAYLEDFYRFCQVSSVGCKHCTVLRFPISAKSFLLSTTFAFILGLEHWRGGAIC